MGDDLGDDFDFPIENESDEIDKIDQKGTKRVRAEHESGTRKEETSLKPKMKKKKKSELIEATNDSPLSRDDVLELFYSLYQKELTLKFVPAELNMGPKLTSSLLVNLPSHIMLQKEETNSLVLQVGKLPSFIKTCIKVPQSAQNNKTVTPGQPHVIMICASALRCCALIPTLRKSTNLLGRSGEHVAKLFAKHQKVPEQVKELKKLSSRIVIGTPNRLHRLIEMKALRFDDCQLVILDMSEKDSKNYSLLTLPGVAQDLMLLFKNELLPATADHNQLKFAFL